MPRDLQGVLKAASVAGSNVAACRVVGGKRKDVQFLASFVSENVGFVESKIQQTLDIQGPILATGVATDIAINGNGMVPVGQSQDGPTTFTRSGSFRSAENGNWVNTAGCALKAWLLDKDGNPPIDNSLISSLSTVNLNNIGSKAEATTSVQLAINLNSDQEQLKGAGKIIKMLGANTATSYNEIISPDDSKIGSLKYGDKLQLTLNNGYNKKYIFELGGITVSKAVGNQSNQESKIFGADDYQSRFIFSQPNSQQSGANKQLRNEDYFTVVVGGQHTKVSAFDSGNTSNNQFYSLATLNSVFNNIPGVVSTIKNNQLYVSPKDPNQSLSFKPGIGSIIEELGLTDVPANNGINDGLRRFNTIDSLKKQMISTGSSLAAVLEGNNGLDFSAAIASDSLQIECKAEQPRKVDKPLDLGGTNQQRASITLTSGGHGLKAGDYIRLTGMTNYANGTYMVTEVSNPNQFSIGILGGSEAVPANFNAPTKSKIPGTDNVTWQRAPGQRFNRKPLPSQSKLTVQTESDNFTIKVTQDNYFKNYPVNTLVYISGINIDDKTSIPDGYYRTIEQTKTPKDAPAKTSDDAQTKTPDKTLFLTGVTPYKFTIPKNITGHELKDVKIQKVGYLQDGGKLIGDNVNFDRYTVASGAAGTKVVRIYQPNVGQYQAGDTFTIEGIAQEHFTIDQVTVSLGRKYTVLNSTQDYIEFEATDSQNTAATGRQVAGSALTKPILGEGLDELEGDKAVNEIKGLYLNFSDRMFSYLSLDPQEKDLAPKYNSESDALSLSSGNQPNSKVFNHAFRIVDSLGSEHQIMLRFAKLTGNRWATEISALKNADGSFDIATTRSDGQILAGILEFNRDGSLIAPTGGLALPIPINWSNNSMPSGITIDWQALAGGLNSVVTSGVRQTAAPRSEVFSVVHNGNTAGALQNISIDEHGFISGLFSNGLIKKLYQIPIVTFANINGLEPGFADTYSATRLSGPAMLKFAGVGANATILSKAVEGSNTETTNELLKIQELQNQIQAEARVINVDNQNFKTVLSELSR